MKAKVKLPPGFKVIAGGGGDAVEWKKSGQIVTGVVVEVKTIERKKVRKGEDPTFRMLRVQTKEGVVSIYEKAALKGLFDAAKKGRAVHITYEGKGKAKKGQSAPYLFTAAMK